VFETIQVEDRGAVLTVTLNRPETRNAFNAVMIDELTTVFRGLTARQGVRVVILRGNGRMFSAGADVTWMRSSLDLSLEENIEDARRMSDMFAAIDESPIPVIGCAHGAALGGGMGLLACCDVAVAAEGTLFGFTEAKLGIVPAVISAFVVPKIGSSWARALFLTAERFGTEVAMRTGLVHWVVPADRLDVCVEEKASELLSSGPGAARATKRLVRDVLASDREGLRDLTARRIAELRTSAEGQEGLRAFLEKRKPSWTADG